MYFDQLKLKHNLREAAKCAKKGCFLILILSLWVPPYNCVLLNDQECLTISCSIIGFIHVLYIY